MIKRTLQWILHWLRTLFVKRPLQKAAPSTPYAASRTKVVEQLNRTLYNGIQRHSQHHSTNLPLAELPQTPTSIVDEPYADHPDKIAALADVAYLCERQGRLIEAERLYQHLIVLKQHRFGKVHLSIVESMIDLALLYRIQKRYGEAQPLLAEVLALQQQLLSPNHPHICETLHQLADTFCQQQQYKESEVLYKQAITAFHKQLGPQHPQSKAICEKFTAMLVTAIEFDKAYGLAVNLLPKDTGHLSEIYSLADPLSDYLPDSHKPQSKS